MNNKNNNKQTLFRFVSLRNPNLVETKKTNLAFIQRAENLKGVFDEVSAKSAQTKLQALSATAATFEATAIKTVEELKKDFNTLIEIGKSIAKQDTISTSDLSVCKNEHYTMLKDTKNMLMIWDNFIYQYLTQKDFYVKEALAYILKALHVGYAQTLKSNAELKKMNGTNFVKTAMQATIIIPLSILERAATSNAKKIASKGLSNKDTGLLTIALEKFEKEQNVLDENENLEQLKAEITSIKNKYWLNYEDALKNAEDLYNKKYEKDILAYEKQIEVIEELEEAKASEAELQKAYELLNSYKIPPFEFSYKEELNWDDIYSQLSEESLAYFLEHFANAAQSEKKEVDLNKAKIKTTTNNKLTVGTNSFSFIHSSYDAILSDINNQVSTNNSVVLTETTLSQNQYVNVGGVVVPVSNATNVQLPHLSYILRARKLGRIGLKGGYVTFQIHVENTSWTVSNAIISATTSTGFHTENISTVAVVNNKINFPSFFRNNIQNISNLTIQIFFANGRETTLQLNVAAINQIYTGILKLKPIKEADPVDDNSNESTTSLGKHFGLKRLGIAEYMKVTQSVHAYVPGEVSNIENVMASELRHKSINELTRTEDTQKTNKSQEVEKISDTTKVDRSEMQTEVIKELDKQRSFNAHANFTYNTGVYMLDIGAAYASANAQHTSNTQAVTKSKEITERAMERVQTKISEERISKIIHEVSLTNVHEYDNRGKKGQTEPPKHITGVYRWVDKKMKNQIYNYGKRTMFEFMIPEPAKLHRLAIKTVGNKLTAPVDPRKAPAPHTMKNATTANASLLEYWADIYGVQLTAEPQDKQQIHKAVGQPSTEGSGMFFDSSFDVLEDYVAKSAILDWYFTKQRDKSGYLQGNYTKPAQLYYSDLKGGFYDKYTYSKTNSGIKNVNTLNLSNTFIYQVKGFNIGSFSVTIKLNCEPSIALKNAWKLENFNKIITAYQKALEAHNKEVARIEAEQATKAKEKKDVMGNFYRIIEGDILKHNCIAYLLQNYQALGQDFTDGDKMLNFKVNFGEDLDKYTAKAKFLEQAFEWSIKDYTFYPYFWADREQWQEMYLSNNTDTLFRSFLQAGLARVVVTVKPGFEEAVQYFLETGKVWMGGETPVIGDPLYMSISQEMKEPTGVPQGKYWITRIPTTLTILQANSVGLKVDKALPIFPENEPENCENPEQLETETPFILDDKAQLSGTGTGETTLYAN